MFLATGYVRDVLDTANIDNGRETSTKKITDLARGDIGPRIGNLRKNLSITDNKTIIANDYVEIKTCMYIKINCNNPNPFVMWLANNATVFGLERFTFEKGREPPPSSPRHKNWREYAYKSHSKPKKTGMTVTIGNIANS
jgi:restriction endonuclease S subunit